MAELYDATDLDYNADSRALLSQVEIYFDEDTPITITKDDYLIDWDILEEVGSDSNNPIGDTSANELSLSLLNEDGLFSVTNVDGPYYGKIKRGVKVIPYIRTAATNWIQLGTFYVNEWVGSLTGLRAEVTCYDKILDVFNSPPVRPAVTLEATASTAFASIFAPLNVPVVVPPTLTNIIEWWYALNNNQETLRELSASTFIGCYCGHNGDIELKDFTKQGIMRAEITDSDQLVSAETTRSLTKEFNGMTLIINKHQLVTEELVSLKDITVAPGVSTSAPTKFPSAPIAEVDVIKSTFNHPRAQVSTFNNTSHEIQYVLRNDDVVDAEGDVAIIGKRIEVVQSEHFKSGSSPMLVDYRYVQNLSLATKQREVIDRYTKSNLPYLNVATRGNPLLQLGDKIKIVSDKYGINFTGVLLRQQFTYTGALRSNLRLIDATILEGA